jgi:hypothetical protein
MIWREAIRYFSMFGGISSSSGHSFIAWAVAIAEWMPKRRAS